MRSGARRCSLKEGITLIELLISMLILSVIAGAGSRLFVTALDSDKESRAASLVYQDAQSVLAMLRKTAANLSSVPVQGIPPYSETFGEKGEGLVYRFVTRVPEYLNASGAEEKKAYGEIRGMLIEFTLERDQETHLCVSRRMLRIGAANEELDKTMSGVLSNTLSDFNLVPLYQSNSGGVGSQTRVPSAFQVRLSYNSAKEQVLDMTVQVPVHSELEKTEEQ